MTARVGTVDLVEPVESQCTPVDPVESFQSRTQYTFRHADLYTRSASSLACTEVVRLFSFNSGYGRSLILHLPDDSTHTP